MSGAADQFLLLRAAAFDRRTSKGDVAVLAEIIQRHMKKHSNARASYTHLTNMTGLSRRAAINSGKRLVELGYVEVARLGSGTRPTEYVPNWNFAASGEPHFTSTSGEAQFTTVVNPTSPLEPLEVNPASLHNPTYRTGRQAELQESRNDNTHAAPTAPLSAGLTAADAGTARDPESAFERFWSAYPRKYQKPKARAAWDKLAPDAELADRIIEAAIEWAAHYEAHPVEKKWIPAPANWLSGERYDEDLPEVYVDAKQAAIAKAKDRPKESAPDLDPVADNSREDVPFWDRGNPATWPAGSYAIKIVDSHVERPSRDEEMVILTYRIVDGENAGEEREHGFWVSGPYAPSLVSEGRAYLDAVMKSVNHHGELSDTADLHDRFLRATVRDGKIEYSALTDEEFDAAADLDMSVEAA